mgnify:CR=1 FL=1
MFGSCTIDSKLNCHAVRSFWRKEISDVLKKGEFNSFLKGLKPRTQKILKQKLTKAPVHMKEK